MTTSPSPSDDATLLAEPQRLMRPAVPAVDDLLGVAFRVLDDGFVRVVDYMGDDASIVQAARVSYGHGTKHINEDRGLIRYLMRHAHTTPFEMCELKLHVRVPMDTWRQWIRHRTASVNEYSTRYSIAIDAAQCTPSDQWRAQSKSNKQGSDDFLDGAIGTTLSEQELELHQRSRQIYEARLAAGVAREQARKDLPLSTYTEAYWKVDLHNLLRFLRLRMDSHAQQEIRSYANVIGREVVAKWCPITWEAFVDYQLNAIELTPSETTVIAHLVAGRESDAIAEAQRCGLLIVSSTGNKQSREGNEFDGKLTRLGLLTAWSRLKAG